MKRSGKSSGRKRGGANAGGRRRVCSTHELVTAVDEIAPLQAAADWDNVGLLAGSADWPVSRALIAIDLTDAVADEALAKQADALVLYHPPIFKPIQRITDDHSATRRFPDLLAARTSIVALHTALDVAVGGTNDVLLDVFALTDRYPLDVSVERESGYKLVVFVPDAEVDGLRAALAAAGAGVIGAYTECSYALHGRGSFRGDETTNPTIGRRQRLEHVDEVRLEMVVPAKRLAPVVRALYAGHSYEEPAFDLYPVATVAGRGAVGLGRVGELRRPTRGSTLVKALGGRVDLRRAAVVGDLRRTFSRVVTAAGSFGVRSFRDPDALVLTGEFRHHEALELLRRGVTAVYLDHYASERPVLDVLQQRLAQRLPAVKFAIARTDRSPLRPL